MDISIVPVTPDQRDILQNLYEKALYEFARYDLYDVEDSGLYGTTIDYIFRDDKHWAFFIKANGKLAGFVTVEKGGMICKDADYQIDEFFVMNKYWRRGVGKFAFNAAAGMFKGKWEVICDPNNAGSVSFWKNVIGEYTNGNYTLIESCPDVTYTGGEPGNAHYGNLFTFDN